ncbi:hypothetical protein ACXYMU_10210 [Pontibacter sp. CAU 1760]
MTHALLSASSHASTQRLGSKGDLGRNVFNFYAGTLLLRAFSLFWLWWTFQQYQLLLRRPPALFWQPHQLLRLLMPTLPSEMAFYTVLGMAAASNGYQLLRGRNIPLLQGLLIGCLLWLNLPQWGYGYLSHVNHTFLLAHLFLTFIPVRPSALAKPDHYLSRSINWYYAGILFTYTLAGCWKIPALLYKTFIHSPDITWLHPDAALHTAFISHRNYDLPFHLQALFTAFPMIWQLGFVVVVYVQGTSLFAAFRQPLRLWVGLFLLLFHGLNMLVFQTYFVVASVVLVCLFLPYDVLLPRFYRKVPPQPVSTLPVDTPFLRFRQRLQQKNHYLAGILYLPGLATVSRLASFFKRNK